MKRRIGTVIGAVCLALGLGAAGMAGQPGPTGQDGDPKAQEVDPEEAESVWQYLLGRYDRDGDGKISREEYNRSDEHFARLDRDGNGTIEKSDAEQKRTRRDRARPRERGTEPTKAIAPSEGDKAPDFDLEVLTPKKEKKGEREAEEKSEKKTEAKKIEKVRLSSFKGKNPVALIFGSYT